MMLNNKYLTEFLGTLFLLYVILASGNPLAIGAALAAAVMVGKSSGGHFNPAVSVAMVHAKRLPMKELLPYVLAQVVGALAALELHKRVRL
tara:strand:+ start:1044 stop:1316 length:273 start_codon:yes stop_codon:yes gene_type:complete